MMNTKLKLKVIGLAFLATSSSINAQVANGDFSSTTAKPTSFDQINRANGWSDANGGTADLYHSSSSKCASMGSSDNRLGSQAPYKGDGYAGVIVYSNNEGVNVFGSIKKLQVVTEKGYDKYSEYITTKLDASLTAGKTYTFTYFVSLAENSGYAVSGFGAHFSSSPINESSNAYLAKSPQMVSGDVVDSKSNWSKVSGSFVAKGGEQYVTIGVFNAPSSKKKVSGGKGLNKNRAYYFIDGISLNQGGTAGPVDSDGDGIADNQDPCPNEYGTNNGCPEGTATVDSDNDGISDAAEKVAGTNPNNPDSDGDGLNDGEEVTGVDQAGTSDRASGKSNPLDACDPKNDGPDCDSDGDKLTNAQEAKLGTDPNNPDTDGDSVRDNDDACPLKAGSVASNGCVLTKEELTAIANASKNIFFNSGKSVIKASSYADLDQLAAILVKHPEVKASIEGHTDSQGNDAMNLNLSKARAKAAKDYLIKKGVKADHISSQGFGETKPVATNDTAEGRAKNRRVIVVTTMYKVN